MVRIFLQKYRKMFSNKMIYRVGRIYANLLDRIDTISNSYIEGKNKVIQIAVMSVLAVL